MEWVSGSSAALLKGVLGSRPPCKILHWMTRCWGAGSVMSTRQGGIYLQSAAHVRELQIYVSRRLL